MNAIRNIDDARRRFRAEPREAFARESADRDQRVGAPQTLHAALDDHRLLQPHVVLKHIAAVARHHDRRRQLLAQQCRQVRRRVDAVAVQYVKSLSVKLL